MLMTSTFSVQVEAELDEEAGVWVATSRDVPGLVAESASLEKLTDMVVELIPILLIENNMMPSPRRAQEIPVHIAARALSKRKVLLAA